MHAIFFVSLTCLIFVLTLRHYEELRGCGRFFELSRTRLDRATIKCVTKVRKTYQRATHYIHWDMFLYVLHTMIYITLLLVRLVEQKLEKGTRFLRSFRKRHIKKVSVDKKIYTITRSNHSSTSCKRDKCSVVEKENNV